MDNYSYVPEAIWGLILTSVLAAITAVVAIIDPWDNGVPWVNWLAITVVIVISVAVATACAMVVDDEREFWPLLACSVVAWAIFASIVIAENTSGERPSIPATYHSLAWTLYAVPLLTLPVSALVQYLAGASAAERKMHGSGENHLRRVA